MDEDVFVEATKQDKATLIAHSLLGFFYYLFPKELTVAKERTDLPKEWHGQQIMSELQRVMICDRSPQIAMRPSRKIAKCIPGHMTVMDYDTGTRVTVKELFSGAHPTILTLNDHHCLKPTKNYRVISNGEKRVYGLTLSDGRYVELTGNHPVLTRRGWIEILKLKDNDLVAAPRTIPVSRELKSSMSSEDAIILGCMLCNDATANGSRHKLLAETFVPDEIFNQPNHIIAVFLKALFSCDRTVGLYGIGFLGYCTNSMRLAYDIKHLLLRFAILANVKPYSGGRWAVIICNEEDLHKFYHSIGFFGPKMARLLRIVDKIAGNTLSGRDRIPTEATIGDLEWLKVSAIEDLGNMETYDVCVPETRNLIVNDFLVHNTMILIRNFYQWSLWHAGRAPTDGLFHTPRENHLTKIRLLTESKLKHDPFLRLIIIDVNRSKGYMISSTGITWYLRIEGKTGTGESMVGPAALYEIGDEQDYATWPSFNERQQAVMPGSLRALGGVPRGVQGGPFWSISNTKVYGEGWSVYRGKDGFNCFINPIYRSEKARRELETAHGGKETQAYQTQVLGLDGARVFSSFPVIPMVVQPFARISITGEDVDAGILYAELSRVSQMPGEAYMLCGDLGRSPSPTEIGYFRMQQGVWVEMARLHITIADSFQTSEAIHAFNMALPKPADIIILDAHGQGTGILDQLHKNEKWLSWNYAEKALDAQFNNYVYDERLLVHSTCKALVTPTQSGWFCPICGVPIFRRDDLEPKRVQTKQWAFGGLKDSFASGQRWVVGEEQKMDYTPIVLNVEDEDLLFCLEGTTEKETPTGLTQWEAPSRHLIDMMLTAVIGADRLSIFNGVESPDWLDEVGWSGGPGNGQLMPWEV